MPINYDCKIEVMVFENIWDRKNKLSYNNCILLRYKKNIQCNNKKNFKYKSLKVF